MFMQSNSYLRASAVINLSMLIALMPALTRAQGTKLQAPKNKYSVQDDVKLGQQAATEVRQQMPTLAENSSTDAYVERVGERLIGAIPPEYQNRAFRYSFDVVNASDINAFALPGGPMFVNRGMIEAARTEGEMAGVMAHEISHVALRHGTAQATKQSGIGIQLGAIGSAILGAVIGGNVGGAVAQGAQLGLGAYLLKYSREYETQADILGAQILARAGYDPRDLASMFKTIEQQGGGAGGPEWLSSHPNPGNRYERINQEAAKLRVERARSNTDMAMFTQIKNDLRRMPPAPTMRQIAEQQPRNQTGGTQQRYPDNAQINESNVPNPANNYRTYNGGNVFSLTVPANWREFPSNNSVTFAPDGAFGDYRGQSVFTHGAIAGVTNVNTNQLQVATDQYVGALLRGNPYLRAQSNYRQGRLDNRTALTTVLGGRSNITGRDEYVMIYTAMLGEGSLFYLINVVPADQQRNYQRAFQNILRSVRFNR
jgi:beta-barrel assembly-enhancing protease